MAQSRVHKRGAVAPEMNMTPLIDVVFQLIIFFMLVNQIINQEQAQMVVPDLDQSQTRELGEVTRVVVSVVPRPYTDSDRDPSSIESLWGWDGEPVEVRVGMNSYSTDQLNQVTEDLEEYVARSERDAEGKPMVEVLLRADGCINYQGVQPVMGAITKAKIANVNMVAYMPGEGPRAKYRN